MCDNKDIEMNQPSDKDEPKLNVTRQFDNLLENAYKTIVKCTKSSQKFPSIHENSLLIASPDYIKHIAETSEKVMTLVDKMLKFQNISKSMSKVYVDGQKDILVEANDKLLESINLRIDLMTGRKTTNVVVNEPKIVKESWNRNANSSNVWQEQNTKKAKNFNIFNSGASISERAQLSFKDKVDNSNDTIFEPMLKEKPNALKPLSILLEKYDAIESFSHPYEYELDLFTPNESLLNCKDPEEPLPISDTPLIFVNTPTDVIQLVEDLKQQSEIAVDLEYHNYRSFQGYTCLMQISTRKKDYIVDTLKLRGDLQIFNEVFTDSKIIKVFHGGDSDIKWLQKDFGIYVVGMFDTHQACKFLPIPRQSLAYLLKHYCGVDSDKTFQLFDWRKRPLPEQAINYARSDTHYLLYIQDCMKKDLIDAAHGKKNLLLSTFSNSTNICKLKYEKPIFYEDGYIKIFRSHSFLTNQQKYALRELYKWRDKTAREMDESIGYILPNHMLLQIAQSIPRDIQGIFACCNPVPLPVKEHVLTLHAIIIKARLQPLTKAVDRTKPEDGVSKKEKKMVAPPHDCMDSQYYKGLPPVFVDKLRVNSQNLLTLPKDNIANRTAHIGLFFEHGAKTSSNEFTKIQSKISRFETPYRRFLKSKEYAKALKEKLDREKAEEKKEEMVPLLSKDVAIKVENDSKISKKNKEKTILKQVKCEERVEMEKEKRKKEKEEEDVQMQPIKKKIKIEKDESIENIEIKTEPKAKQIDKSDKSAVPKVDYSKINFNKYMVKGKNNKKKKGTKKKR